MERIIWAGAESQFPIRVSDADYGFLLLMGKWLVTHPGKRSRRGYAYQTFKRAGKSRMIWMHKVVLLRPPGPPPTPLHVIGDHLDGDPWVNRRHMLRWATVPENNRNRHGAHWKQMDLFRDYLRETYPLTGCYL